MSGRMVSAAEARSLLEGEPGDWRFVRSAGGYVERANLSDVAEVFNDDDGPLVAAAPDLAHTVVQQAEQIAAVLALHTATFDLDQGRDFCDGCDHARPCPTVQALRVES